MALTKMKKLGERVKKSKIRGSRFKVCIYCAVILLKEFWHVFSCLVWGSFLSCMIHVFLNLQIRLNLSLIKITGVTARGVARVKHDGLIRLECTRASWVLFQ